MNSNVCWNRITLFLVFVSVYLALPTFGQTTNYSIQTLNGNFVPDLSTKKDLKLSNSPSFDHKTFKVIQFFTIPDESLRKEWEKAGLILVDYLPNYAYFAVISNSFKLKKLNGLVRSVFSPGIELKLEQELFQLHQVNHLGEQLNLTLSYYKSLDYDLVAADLKNRGVQIIENRTYSYQIDVRATKSQLEDLINLTYLQFIGLKPENPTLEADNYSYRNAAGNSNFINSNHNGLLYNGTGVTIAIGEGGTVGNNIDFKGRLIELMTGAVSDHKVGTAQNGCGAGNWDPTDRNNAWGSQVISFNSQSYTSLITGYQARYFNHSYGYGVQGGYNSGARDHDLRVQSYPNHLVSYSSGNDGGSVGYAPYNNITGWANITGAVKQNKNHLAVNSFNSDDNPTGFGSTGPAYDGRIIPQLVIAGPEGTSYASPKAVGIFAELEQAYKASHSSQESNSSLMKGIILNTADDAGNAGPDFRYGYGKPNVRRAYQVIVNNQFIYDSISNGGNNTHQISVPANVKQVRVLLIWQDAAAVVNANPAIVNNLDLTGQGPASGLIRPWILDHTPNLNNISLPAVRGRDSINTVEQITYDDPAAGTWQFNVSGYLVPSGPQRYFITYEFIYNDLILSYPLSNEKLIAGKNYLLKWESYGDSSNFDLEYRINGGTWQTIESNISGNLRKYNWIAPMVTGVEPIEVRVIQGSLISQSGINYVGKVPESFHIFKVCSDTVELKWSAVLGADSYKVYRLGNQYMDEVTTNITFNGTSAVLTGQSITSSEYYAVSAVDAGLESQKAYTIEKIAGDFGCGGIDWIGGVSTDWFNPANWEGNQVPDRYINVRIPASAPFQPIIANTGAVCRSIDINSNASLGFSPSTAYALNVWGDWINNGSFMAGIGNVIFSDTTSYQEISGTSTTNFYNLSVVKNSPNNILEVKSLITLLGPTNPLTLTSGTFQLSSASTITPFTSSSAAYLTSSKCIWNNGGTINFGNFSWYIDAGKLKCSAGTINLGTAANNSVIYMNNGQLIVEGGNLNFAGRLVPNSSISSGKITILGGTLVMNTMGSTSTTSPIVNINPNATFVMAGGTIILKNASSNTGADYLNQANNYTVTGGTLRIGNGSTASNQIIRIQSTIPVYNLELNGTGSTIGRLLNSDLTINNDVSIFVGQLATNGYSIKIKGDWLNNGSFLSSLTSDTVHFIGSSNQVISGSSVTQFKNLTLNNPNGMTLLSNDIAVNGLLKFVNGVIQTNTSKVIVNGSVLRILGHVAGRIQKPVNPFASTVDFELGDNLVSAYTPLNLTFYSVQNASTLVVGVTPIDHPNIGTSTMNSNYSVNRNWSIQNNGVAFASSDITCQYLMNDLDVNTTSSLLRAGIYDGATWNYPSVQNAGTNSTSIIGTTGLGAIQLAYTCTDSQTTSVIASCDAYVWSVNGNTYTSSGVYAHQQISAEGCLIYDTLNLTLTASPNAQISDNGLGTLTALGGTVVNWIDCTSGLSIPGQTGPTFTPTLNGSYAVVLSNGSCQDSSDCFLVDYLAVSDINLFDFQIFPNPTQNQVTISMQPNMAELRIIDVQGKVMLQQVINSGTKISLDGFDNGVYLFEMSFNGYRTVRRIIKNG